MQGESTKTVFAESKLQASFFGFVESPGSLCSLNLPMLPMTRGGREGVKFMRRSGVEVSDVLGSKEVFSVSSSPPLESICQGCNSPWRLSVGRAGGFLCDSARKQSCFRSRFEVG